MKVWRTVLVFSALIVMVATALVDARSASSRGRGQSPAAPAPGNPAFEVASVKPNTSRDAERDGNLTGRRITLTYVTLRELVQFAYPRPDGGLRDDAEIVGGPGWITADHFDVVGTVEGLGPGLDAAATAAGAATAAETAGIGRVRLMMRTLLTDRFKLAVHDEFRDLPIYVLVLARGDGSTGPQLRKVDDDCLGPRPAGSSAPCGGFIALGPGHRTGHAVPVSLLTTFLEGAVQRRVVDRTGLAGRFDVDLQWTPDQPQGSAGNPPPIDGNGPSIFTAVREQLGMKLESARGPVDVLVIDQAEKPTPD